MSSPDPIWVPLWAKGVLHFQPDPARPYTACGMAIPATTTAILTTRTERCRTCDHQFTYIQRGIR